jgi:hypothetical protein
MFPFRPIDVVLSKFVKSQRKRYRNAVVTSPGRIKMPDKSSLATLIVSAGMTFDRRWSVPSCYISST